MRLIGMLFILMLFNSSAFAACASPVGQEGDQMYNSTYKTMQFCDGTNWYSMKGGASGGSGADCVGKSVTWGNCSATLPNTLSGITETAADPGNPTCFNGDYYGTKAYGCRDGTWLEGSSTCQYLNMNNCGN